MEPRKRQPGASASSSPQEQMEAGTSSGGGAQVRVGLASLPEAGTWDELARSQRHMPRLVTLAACS